MGASKILVAWDEGRGRYTTSMQDKQTCEDPSSLSPLWTVLVCMSPLVPPFRQHLCVSLQDGVATTGVSVAFTVLACDAGPIFLQEQVAVPEDEQAPQLLERLFKQGAQLLISNIDRVWTGEAAEVAWQQDHAQATHAAKVSGHGTVCCNWCLRVIPPISSLRCSLHCPG